MPAKKKTSTAAAASSIWFVTGSDEAEVKKYAAALARELGPGDDPFSHEVIDGAVGTVDEAIDRVGSTIQALNTLPMFGGDKFVWLKNASFLADSVTGRSEAVQTALEKLLSLLAEGLPGGVKFLLSASGADKRRSAYKTLCKLAETTIKDKPDFGFNATEADLQAWVGARAREHGVELTDEALAALTARVGAESGPLDLELAKLGLAAEGRPVSAELVRTLVPISRQGGIFDLSDCLLRRDLTGAITTVEQLLRQKETGLGLLLAAIVPTLRNLFLVKDLMVRHRLSPPAKPFYFGKTLEGLPRAATAHLPRKKDGTLNAYPLGLAAQAAGLYSIEELRTAFLRARNLNREFITRSLPDSVLLGRFLIQLLGQPAS
jgi:DNA polymerase-3 subunit delta